MNWLLNLPINLRLTEIVWSQLRRFCWKVVLLTNSLYELAFNLFKQREDKEWGLVDCISFIVMEDRGITDGLTTDIHFQQAGFRALSRD
jgi:predicted nucleic acid-binding protein